MSQILGSTTTPLTVSTLWLISTETGIVLKVFNANSFCTCSNVSHSTNKGPEAKDLKALVKTPIVFSKNSVLSKLFNLYKAKGSVGLLQVLHLI